MPAHWGFPSPMYNHDTAKYEVHGMVWHGKEPCSKEDMAALQARFGADVVVDMPSLVGRKSKHYTTYHKSNARKHPYKRTLRLGWPLW